MGHDLLHSRQQRVSKAALCCTVILLGFIGAAVYKHPASVADSLTAVATTVGALIVFGLLSIWTLTFKGKTAQTALLIGTATGAILGAVEMANIAFEYSSVGSGAVHAVAVPLSMAVMVVLFGSAGSIAYERTSSLKLSIFSGLWCAMVGTLITCIFGFAYSLIFMPHLVQILHVDIFQSGMHDEAAYVLRNTIESGSNHLLLAPLLGAVCSFIGGFLSSQLRAKGRSTAAMFGVFGVVQLALCITLIHFGLSLARSERPPFISAGMLGAGLALTYVWPVLSVLIGGHKLKIAGPHDSAGHVVV